MKNFESRKTERKCNKGFMNKNCYKDCPHATMIFFKSDDLFLFHFRSGTIDLSPGAVTNSHWLSDSDRPPESVCLKISFMLSYSDTVSDIVILQPWNPKYNNFLILQTKNELTIQIAKHKLFQKLGLHRKRTLLPDEVIMGFVLNSRIKIDPSSNPNRTQAKVKPI